jgi:hypothetical protein
LSKGDEARLPGQTTLRVADFRSLSLVLVLAGDVVGSEWEDQKEMESAGLWAGWVGG